MKRGTRALSVALWVLAGWSGPRATALAGGATAGGNAEAQAARKDVKLARPGHRAPIYFNILHHQEDVGRPCHGLGKFERFRSWLLAELDLLDSHGVVSDQYFSDYIVSVVEYKAQDDPSARDVFTRFANSRQNLGYHFHPSTWDVLLRIKPLADLLYDDAVAQYEILERQYYDWSGCFDANHCTDCGMLDPQRLTGGIEEMEAHFGKRTCVENFTIGNAPVGQVLRARYGDAIVGWAGGPHSYYNTGNEQFLWMDFSLFTPEPNAYVHKIMGLCFAKTVANAWIERTAPVAQLEQLLLALPRDVPHLFVIHLSDIEVIGEDPLHPLLHYLQDQFFPANPGSGFVSGADIPGLVVENRRTFSMNDLEEAALSCLRGWQGRPPAVVRCDDGTYLSLASLFKGLQEALRHYLGPTTKAQAWPAVVTVADFIMPPLGTREDVPHDSRLGQPIPAENVGRAAMLLPLEDRIPYVVPIPAGETPILTNPAEFLNGMCNLFLQLRRGRSDGVIFILPSYVIPLSNLPSEIGLEPGQPHTQTRLDWYNGLQLWTAEPLRLTAKGVGRLPQK